MSDGHYQRARRFRRLAGAFLLSASVCAAGAVAAQVETPALQPADPAPCRLCHGREGSGKPGINAPRLAGQYRPYLLKQLEDFASGERQNRLMSPVAEKLSPAEMEAHADFFSEQIAPVQIHSPKPSQVERGESIAMHGTEDGRVQPCSDCHGPRGLGDPPLIPYIAGQLPDYLEHALTEFKTGKRTNDPYRIMRHVASGLSEAQIKALAAYYGSLPPRTAERE